VSAYALLLPGALVGGSLAHWGPTFLAWTDARRATQAVAEDPWGEFDMHGGRP
jgi:hypothetical protein